MRMIPAPRADMINRQAQRLFFTHPATPTIRTSPVSAIRYSVKSSLAPLTGETRILRDPGAKKSQATRNQNPACSVEQAKRSKNDAKGLTMLISTLALAMSIAMMVSAIVILYNETVARKQKPSFE